MVAIKEKRRVSPQLSPKQKEMNILRQDYWSVMLRRDNARTHEEAVAYSKLAGLISSLLRDMEA